MSSILRTCVVIFFAACGALISTVHGDELMSAVRKPLIDKWIQQLGDESYVVRENATRQLSVLGLTIKSELLAGVRGPDPEIRWRCARLWEAVRGQDFEQRSEAFLSDAEGIKNYEFPGWERFRQVFGSATTTRRLFLSLQRSEPRLWEEFGVDPSNQSWRFEERCRQLKLLLGNPQTRSKIVAESALTVLFMTVQQPSLSDEDLAWTKGLWELAAVVDLARADTAWESLRSNWLREFGDDLPAFERLMSGLRDRRQTASLIARNFLRDKNAPASQKQYALVALALTKDRADESLIKEFSQDSTLIDTYFKSGIVIKSQMQDVALACLIHRTGRDPQEFGFKYAKSDENTLYSVSTLGFQNDKQRTAAFEQWNEFVSNQTAEP